MVEIGLEWIVLDLISEGWFRRLGTVPATGSAGGERPL